jgi:hypothetical protein
MLPADRAPSARLRLALAAIFMLLPLAALRAVLPVDMNLLAAGYSEDFDALPTANFTWADNVTLPGWYAVAGNGSQNTAARVMDGGSNPADLTIGSVGTAGIPERALTYHTRVSATPTYLGLGLLNQSGRALTGFEVAWVAEQWKEGTNQRTLEIGIEYRVGAVPADLSAGAGWTPLSGTAHDTLNGAVGARTALSSGPVAVGIADGQTLWLRWKTTNTAESSTSSHDLLAVDDVTVEFLYDADPVAPVFTLQPLGRHVAVTESITFTVAASGNPTPTYQWSRDGVELDGATGPTLTLENIQLSDAGDYTVAATNEAGSETSQPATLLVSPTPLPPSITAGPADTTRVLGEELLLTVEVVGSPPFSYQWRRDGEDLDGATAAEFQLASVGAQDAGSYTVVVSNVADSVTSAAALVTVILPPTITTDPQAQTVGLGEAFVLSVTADGVGPFSYQWSKDEDLLLGAVGPTLSVAAATAGDAGEYTVEVFNVAGGTVSSGALVTVLLPPVVNVAPVGAQLVVGGSWSFSVGVSGTPPFSYQWRKDGTDLDGATASTLSLSGVTATDAGAYDVVVTNLGGATTSASASLVVHPSAIAPTISAAPVGFTAAAETNAQLQVGVTGTAPFTYQWFREGVAISGKTGPVLTFAPLALSDAGSYSVTVSNDGGSVTSSPVTVGVTPSTFRDYYVAPDGLEGNPGTFESPTTLTKAISLIEPGYTIHLRGGTYTFSTQITIARTNTGLDEARRKRIFAYVSPEGVEEQPRLDFSSQPYGRTSQVSNPRGLQINGHWWHVRGLEIFGAADNGIFIAGNHNIIERCVTHSNRDTGLQLGRYASTVADKAEWPAYNLILNCTSYDNYDSPPNSGENADGFAAKLTTGPGNVFRGCIAHNNIDDGWDLFTKSGTGAIFPVVIDQCIAYNNGTLTDGTQSSNGDRNGFKLGGAKIPVVHYVTRSIAFGNGKNGFTWNSNPAPMLILNNLAFDNARGNFKFDLPSPLFYNNVSLYTSARGENDRYGGNSGIATGPSNVFWFVGSSSRGPSINDRGITVSAASFKSLSLPPGGFNRHPDGSIDLGDFAQPVDGSPLFDAGELPPVEFWSLLPYDVAVYYENAPDIGVVETRREGIPSGGAELFLFAFGPSAESSALPAMPTLSRGDGTISITFNRLRAELIYEVELSVDLLHWTTLATDPGQVGDTIEVMETLPLDGTPRFLRVKLQVR